MKKMIIVCLCLIFSGCAIFMPYKEDFLCSVPEGKGYCGSLTDVYEYSITKK